MEFDLQDRKLWGSVLMNAFVQLFQVVGIGSPSRTQDGAPAHCSKSKSVEEVIDCHLANSALSASISFRTYSDASVPSNR